MENLPFLSKNEEPSPNVRPPRSESEWPQGDFQPAFQPMAQPPVKPDVLDALRANPMGLVLLGIIIGFLLANMRPVIIKN